MKIFKNIFSFLLISLISFWVVNWWWVYNIYSESYIHGCNWSDNTTDHCKAWEIVLYNDKWGASQDWSYRCWKTDYDAPTISVTWINPESNWVNIDKYNPIKNLNISVSDAWAWIRQIKIEIWVMTLTYIWWWSSRNITYNNICNKLWYDTNSCYKKLLYDGKNSIVVTAWDRALDYYGWSVYHSNISHDTKYVWVDSSRSSFKILGNKPYLVEKIDSKVLNSISSDNAWKNKSLNSKIEVWDLYWESSNSITLKTKTCTSNNFNSFSIWTQPSWVNPNNWKFTSYCTLSSCSPSINDCSFECKDWYVKDKNWKCIIQKKQFSCKNYFEGEWYNISNVDWTKLFYALSWYGSSIINSNSWLYTWVYNSISAKYSPSTDECQIVPWTWTIEIDAKDANGNNIKQDVTVNWIVKIGSLINFELSEKEETCSVSAQLADFVGGNQNRWNWNVPVFKFWLDNGHVGKDDDWNWFVDNEEEWAWQYQITDSNWNISYTTDLTKACWKIQCVANASKGMNWQCICDSWYFPIDNKLSDGRYDECVSLTQSQALVDANGDGFYNTIKSLASNQIVKRALDDYSTDQVPVYSETCSNWTIAKDTDGDWWKDLCVLNWTCWSANGGSYTDKPTSNLCSKWTESSVNTNWNKYYWSCNGNNWGTNANCSATKSN